MRIASLDLGSNSFLCLIVDTNDSAIEAVICDEVRVVRLSEGVQGTGLLSLAALDRAKSALAFFKKLVDDNKVDQVVAVTTAVARQAKNSDLFLDMVKDFGFPIKLVSGAEEAEITYLGAASGLKENENLLVVDIGGGSTELIFDRIYAQSFNFGVVRIKEKFNIQYPITEDETKRILEYIDTEIYEFISKIERNKIVKAIAVAGTPTTLAAMEIGKYDPAVVDGYHFSLVDLELWYQKLAKLKPEEIVNIYQIDVSRADVIAIGILILIQVLKMLRLPGLEVSIRGVRYGVILKSLRESLK
jgi:exopolyphosphatase/guanosine-5'-triphosphate,3'-diphosphate pyrophosphatase